MRLMQRYTAALVVGVLGVLAIYSYLQARALRDFALETLRNQHRSMGAALAAVVAEVWRVDGEARALALVNNLGSSPTGVQVRFVWVDEIASELYRPRAPLDLLRNAIEGHGELVWQDEDERFVTYVPLDVTSTLAAALELSQSLEPMQRELDRSSVAIILAALGILLVAGALALLLGVLMLGRPVRDLTLFARRIGDGDFSRSLEVKRQDELGVLTKEMNAMSAQLASAHDARLATEKNLRRVDRLATVGKLAAGLAHELGTPLNTIGISARRIEVLEGTNDGIAKHARIIREQGDRMGGIVRQLLDFARPKAPAKARVEMVALVRRTLELLQPLAKQSGVELALAEGSAALHIEADLGQLQQLLSNLTVNAIQAMPQGGVVRHSLAQSLMGSPPLRYVKLEVADAGTGIAAEHLPHLFDPFFTTKEVGQGTGLGLAVAFGIVQEHQGFIDVQSKVGVGTVFSVYLPVEAT